MKKSRFRVPKFNPETDDRISYLQVVYGEYDRNMPIIERVWVFEKYWCSIIKGDELKPGAFYHHPGCEKKVCGNVFFQSRTKTELQQLEKLKEKEFRLAWNRLTGWNLFTIRPTKDEMLAFIQNSLNEKKKLNGQKILKR